MYELPTSITIEDRQYQITDNGDYRVILDCFSALSDSELSEDEKVLASLLIFYNEFDDIEDIPQDEETFTALIKEMYRFFNCGQEEIGANAGSSVIDWETDTVIITAAVNNVAHTEIRALPYLHWWTFMGYYMSIGESILSTVVGIRSKLNKNKKLDDWEKDFKRDNPQYFNWKRKTKEELDLDEYVRNIWNNGGQL
jgi:hypothetical protein